MKNKFKYLIFSVFALLILSCGIVFLSHNFSTKKIDEQVSQETSETDAWFTYIDCYDRAYIDTLNGDKGSGVGQLCMWHEHDWGLQYIDYFKICMYPGFYIKNFTFNVQFNTNHSFTVKQSSPDANPTLSWSTLYKYKVSLDRSGSQYFGGWVYTIELDGHSSSTYIEEATTGIRDDYYSLSYGSGADGITYTINLNNQSATTAGTTVLYEKYFSGFYSDSAATTALNSITVPQKTGYTFDGYYSSANGQGTKYIDKEGKFTAEANNMIFTSNTTLYANWIAGVYPIDLVKIGGSGGTSTIYEKYNNGFYLDSACTKKMTTSANPVIPDQRPGYTLDGYYYMDSDSNETKFINSNGYLVSGVRPQIPENGYLYANWTEIQYKIAYNLNKGSASTTPVFGSDHPTGPVNFTAAFTVSNPSMPGYTFAGWTFDGDTSTAQYFIKTKKILLIFTTEVWGDWTDQGYKTTKTKFKKLGTTNNGTVTLKANWKEESYNVVFNDNKASYPSMNSVITQTIYSPSTEQTWQSAGNTNSSSKSYTVSGFAKFDNAINNTAVASATGWRFDGYYTEATGGTQLIGVDGKIKANVSGYTNSTGKWIRQSGATVYAHWTPITYTIAKPSGNISATYDQVSEIAVPNKTGYTFLGWTMTNGDTNTALYGASSDSLSSWSDPSTKVTSTIFKNLTSTNGATVTLTPNYKENIYTVNLDNQNANTAGTTTVYEKYDKGYYLDSATTKQMTSSANPITVPRKTGYTFEGYYTATSGGTQYINQDGKLTSNALTNNFATNGTLYARWTANIYTITLNNQSATAAGTTTIYEKYNNGFFLDAACTKKITTSSNKITLPTRTGYTFDGYFALPNGDGTLYLTKTGFLANSISTTSFVANVTLYAGWTANIYTIALNNQSATTAGTTAIYEQYENGYFKDSKAETEMTPSSEPITLPAKTGYTFRGYFTQTNGGGNLYIDTNGYLVSSASNTNFTANGTLYAYWTINQYTLKFVDAIGLLTEVTQDYNTTIPVLTPRDKVGYTTVGWDQTVPTSMPAENKTFNAVYSVNQYTLTFLDEDETTVITTLTQDYGTSVSVEKPEKLGKQFKKWDKTVPATMPAEDTTFVAQWLINGYDIAYELNGGVLDLANPDAYDVETETFTLNNPRKTGYTFVGWSGTDIAGTALTVTIPVGSVGDRSYEAHYTINQYTITLQNWLGTIDTITQDYNTQIPQVADPEVAGYTFVEWSEAIPTAMPAEDKTITASYTKNTYSIVYTLNGGKLDQNNPITYDVESATFTLANPSKTGYTFNGWEGTDLSQPTQEVTIENGSIGNREYSAKFTINKYSLTLLKDDGSTIATLRQDYGTKIASQNNPYKRGYKFVGWSEPIPSRMPAEDKTITANFEVEEYTITYNFEDSQVVNNNPVVYTVDTETFTIGEPEYVGHEFVGWTDEYDTDLGKTIEIRKGTYNNKTYTAHFNLIEYTITKVVDEEELYEHYTIDSDTFALTNPTKEGFRFVGWTEDEGDTPVEIVTIENGSTEDRVYLASFEIVTYNITYQLDGGVVDGTNPTSYTIDSEDIILINPTKTGFTFVGWTYEGQDTPVMTVKIEKGSTGDKDFIANYQVNEYTITYKDGDRVIAEITQEYGEEVDLPETPVKPGYNFNGWVEAIPQYVPAENLIINARFEVVVYTITYILDEGVLDGENPTEYTVETDDFTLINPTREGYIFNGWKENVEDKPSTDYTIEKGTTGNKTLTAVWSKQNNMMPIYIGAGAGGVVLIAFIIGLSIGLAKKKKKSK